MSIIKKFDALMSHLNAEENGMAEEFKSELQKLHPETEVAEAVKYNLTKMSRENTLHFSKLVKYLFDDAETVEKEYSKHSACDVTLLAKVDLEVAMEAVAYSGTDIPAEDLVGNWLTYASSDYNWGIDWDCVYEVCRGQKVVETKTETNWISIHVEETVPAMPGVCEE